METVRLVLRIPAGHTGGEAALARDLLKADLVAVGRLGENEEVSFHSILTAGPVTYADTQSMARVKRMFAEEAKSLVYEVQRISDTEYHFTRAAL